MRPEQTKPGFTLLEVMLSVMIMSIIAAVVMPTVAAATDGYASARSLRSSVESASFAIERVRRVIREAPGGAAEGSIGVVHTSATHLEFSDGNGVRLAGETLELLGPSGSAPLARSVSAFNIQYISADGVTPAADPSLSQRIHVTMTVGGVAVSTCAFPRANAGGGV